MPELLFGPTPHAEAAAFIAGKPPVCKAVFDQLLPELKALAFTVTGVEELSVLAAVQSTLTDLPAGVPWDKLKKQLVNQLHPYLDDAESGKKRALARAELLLRTHGFQAYQAASHAVMKRQTDVFPYWQYKSKEDGRVRPAHAALDNIVLPANHEFWKTHFPPWQWNCRCQCVPLSQNDYADIQKEDEAKPKDRRSILDPDAQQTLTDKRVLVRNGVAYNVSSDAEKGKEGAYSWHPDNLRPDLSALKARTDPTLWAKFVTFATQQKVDGHVSVWDWLQGVPISPAPGPSPIIVPPNPGPQPKPKPAPRPKPAPKPKPAKPAPWTPRPLSEAEIAAALASVHLKAPEPAGGQGGEQIPSDPSYSARIAGIAGREQEAIRRHYAASDIYKAEARGAHAEAIATWSNAQIRAIRARFEAERRALPPPQIVAPAPPAALANGAALGGTMQALGDRYRPLLADATERHAQARAALALSPHDTAVAEQSKRARALVKKLGERQQREAVRALTLPQALRTAVGPKNQPKNLKDALADGFGFLQRITHRDQLGGAPVEIRTKHARAGADTAGAYIDGKSMNGSIVAHEMGHIIEARSPALLAKSLAFRDSRTAGETPTWLGTGYKKTEVALEDQWVAKGGNHYSGKVYRSASGKDRGSEILSMGLERLKADAVKFAQDDRDYFEHVVNCLRGT